jgi:hypothetical protein
LSSATIKVRSAIARSPAQWLAVGERYHCVIPKSHFYATRTDLVAFGETLLQHATRAERDQTTVNALTGAGLRAA